MKALNQFVIGFIALAMMSSLGGCLTKETTATLDSGGPTNNAPTISGTPSPSVLIDKQYSFTPSASDVDNDPLTFSVSGEPTWLNIDANSGALTGTPTLANVGTYSGITVSVTDGSLSSSLPEFRVDVVQNADGSVTLSWAAPALNEDGTALTDLAGYKIYYGTSSRNYTTQIPVDLGTTTLVVDNLTPDTYFFAATAINSADVESQYSGEAVRMVN